MTEVGRVIAHKTTHQDGGADEIDATGLPGRCNFIDRGDPSVYDFLLPDFITDGTEHDLDLSGIVPVNTKAVLVFFSVAAAEVGRYIYFRPKEHTNWQSSSQPTTIVSNLPSSLDLICPIGVSRKLTYLASNTTFLGIYFIVKGWWI